MPGKARHPFLLRSDNGLAFTSRSYTDLVKNHGLQQEFITPYSPGQNGMVEGVIRTRRNQCVRRHLFETRQHARSLIAVGSALQPPAPSLGLGHEDSR